MCFDFVHPFHPLGCVCVSSIYSIAMNDTLFFGKTNDELATCFVAPHLDAKQLTEGKSCVLTATISRFFKAVDPVKVVHDRINRQTVQV